VLMLETCRG